MNEEKKPTITIVVEFDDVDECTLEGCKRLVEEGQCYGRVVKAELTNLPDKMNFA